MTTWRNTGADAEVSLPSELDEAGDPTADATWRPVLIPAGSLFTVDPTTKGGAWIATAVEAMPDVRETERSKTDATMKEE